MIGPIHVKGLLLTVKFALIWPLKFHRFPANSLPSKSTAVKRLGQFFVLFRKISFTMNWKQIYIIAVELSVNIFLFLPNEQASLLFQ